MTVQEMRRRLKGIYKAETVDKWRDKQVIAIYYRSLVNTEKPVFLR